MYISIAAHYVRPKQILYLKETFQRVIRDVVQAQDLNLEADPVEVINISPCHVTMLFIYNRSIAPTPNWKQ